MTIPAVVKLIEEALLEGRKAGEAAVPTPMGVVDGPTTWVVSDGVCGFAWVNIKPAYSPVAKELVRIGLASKDSYNGGVTVWIHEYNQSMARKEAHARAFAEILSRAGVRAHAGSRMD